jgi:ribose transport system substrate-binding protein
MKRSTRHAKRITQAMLIALIGVSLAACGSSNSGSVSSGTVSGTADSSSQPPAPAVAAAGAFVAKYEQMPASIGVSEPLKTRPAPGRTLVYLQCDAPQCALETPILAAATTVVGWKLKVLNYQAANPATFLSALTSALQYHPVATTFTAIAPYAVWSSIVPQYKAAGVAIIPLGGMDTPTNATIVRNVLGRPDIALQAQVMADWFIADSGGHGKALFWTVPQAPAINYTQEVFSAEVAKSCPDCSVKLLEQALPDVAAGDAPADIASALRSDPSLRYVILGNIVEASGLEAALKTAGVSGVKIAGFLGGAADQEAVRSGSESAVTPLPLTVGAWQVVDAALRYAEGMPVTPATAPFQLLTTATMTATNISASGSYPYPANYQDLFKQLWDIS